jgi:hypothetical protein
MIQVGNDGVLKRGDIKIGWLRNNHIFDHNDNKIGYFVDNKIFNIQGQKIAFIEGEFMYLVPADTKTRLEDNSKVVMGAISDAARAAICLLLG